MITNKMCNAMQQNPRNVSSAITTYNVVPVLRFQLISENSKLLLVSPHFAFKWLRLKHLVNVKALLALNEKIKTGKFLVCIMIIKNPDILESKEMVNEQCFIIYYCFYYLHQIYKYKK